MSNERTPRLAWRAVLCLALWAAASPAAMAAAAAGWRRPSPQAVAANLAKVMGDPPREVVRNPGFEEGQGPNAKHWGQTCWDKSGPVKAVGEVAVVRTDEAAHGGRYAVKMCAPAAQHPGGVFSLRQVLPIDAIRGKRVRFTAWCMLQTMPRPDMDPVTLSLRQWRGRKVIAFANEKVYCDTGEWQLGELATTIKDEAERADIRVWVRNTSGMRPEAIHFIDDVSVKPAADPALSVHDVAPEVPDHVRRMKVHCTIGQALEQYGPFGLAFVVCQRDLPLRLAEIETQGLRTRGEVSIKGLPPGDYTLETVLTLPKVGPAAADRRSFRIYRGPFHAN